MGTLGGFMATDFVGNYGGTGLSDAIRGPAAEGPLVMVANSEAIFVGARQEGAAHPIIIVDIRDGHIEIIKTILKAAVKSLREDTEAEQIEAWEEKLEEKFDDANKLIERFKKRNCSVAALGARAPKYHYVLGDIASRETAAAILKIVEKTPVGVIYASNIEHYVGVPITAFPDNALNSSRTKAEYKACILDLMSPNTTLVSGPLNMGVYGNKIQASEKWLAKV